MKVSHVEQPTYAFDLGAQVASVTITTIIFDLDMPTANRINLPHAPTPIAGSAFASS